MKLSIIIAISVVLSLPSYAQQTKTSFEKHIPSLSKTLAKRLNPTRKIEKNSNDDRISQVLRQVPQNGFWVDLTKINYSYTPNGNVNEIGFTYLPGLGNWDVIWNKVHLESTWADTLIHSEMSLGILSEKTRMIYTYDYAVFPRVRLTTSIETQIWVQESDTWISETKQAFEYNSESKAHSITSYYLVDTDWVNDEKTVITESENNVYEMNYVYDGQEWVLDSRTIYKNTTIDQLEAMGEQLMSYFDSFGLSQLMAIVPEMEEQEYINGGWFTTATQTKTNEYDFITGQLLSQIIDYKSDFGGEALELESTIILHFDANQDVFRATLDIYVDNEAYRFSEELHTYTSQGRPHTTEIRMNFGEGLTPISKIIVSYGTSTSIEHEKPVKQTFELHSAYPNPFNPSTTIRFTLNQAAPVSIRVYDMLGRQVNTLYNQFTSAGSHSIAFNAFGLSSGTYLVRMESSGVAKTQKLTLLK